MTTAALRSLPEELLELIASFAGASAVLQLSQTCRAFRKACWHPRVFKKVLAVSQRDVWASESLDLEAVASRASEDVAVWARYCIADERASVLDRSVSHTRKEAQSSGQHPLQQPKHYVGYLADLLVIHHPFTNNPHWDAGAMTVQYSSPRQAFSHAMVILASEDTMLNSLQALHSSATRWFPAGCDTAAFLAALCTIALWARTKIKQRLAAWPYNEFATSPFITLPKAHQIPLRPLNDTYSLPLPFSRRAVELLGNAKSSFSAWDSWYRLHNLAAATSSTYLTEGTWEGYYIRFGIPDINLPIDPPMKNIRFVVDNAGSRTDSAERSEVATQLIANSAEYGGGEFDIEARMTCDGSDIKIAATLAINSGQGGTWSLDWDCRLTPFGIVGFWGQDRQGTLQRFGIVWLWKSEWRNGERI